MRNIPNIISILRILLSAGIFFLKPFSLMFLIVYSLCGFSDIIDGYIARKTGSSSKLGAVLDSIGDIAFIGFSITVLLPVIQIPIGILICIIVIAFIRALSILIAYIKYNTFASLHTYGNKAAGFLLFCTIYLYRFININILGYAICTIAALSAVEELIIQIKSKELERDIKGIFLK